MADTDHSELLAKFSNVTGADADRARFYLESAAWKLDVSIWVVSELVYLLCFTSTDTGSRFPVPEISIVTCHDSVLLWCMVSINPDCKTAPWGSHNSFLWLLWYIHNFFQPFLPPFLNHMGAEK